MPEGPRPDPPTRCCKLVYSGDLDGYPWANVMWLYFTGSGTITTSALNDVADAAAAAYGDAFAPYLAESWELTSTQLVLYSTGDEPLEVQGLDVVAGGNNITPAPANVAMCISWHISPHYRGGHPRTYLTGFGGNQIANPTTWEASTLLAIDSAAAAFHGDLESITATGIASTEHGIVSFVRGGEWRTPPVFYRISEGHVDSRIDSQRRRLGRDRT